jgi:thioredoxin-related protein
MKHFELILAAALCGSLCTGAALNAADTEPAKEAKESAKKAKAVWLTDFEAAKKQAAAEKKPILMFFTGSDWCGWCMRLHENVLDKDEFQDFAKDSVVLLELDFPREKQLPDELKKQNDKLNEKFKIEGYPTMVLVAPDGERELDRTVGYDSDLVKKLKKTVKKSAVDAKKKSGEDAAGQEAGEEGEKPAWLTDFEAAKKQAAAEKKPILMFFTGSDWCIWCQRLHEGILDKPEFAEFSKKLVLVELDFPQEKELPAELKKQNAELAEKFKVDGYPCTVVLASDGETKLGTLSGYSPEYIAKIQDILDGKGKPVTMDELRKHFSYLPDMLVEYEDLKLTREDLLDELFEEEPSAGDLEQITPEAVGMMIQANLDDAILLYLAQKAGFIPSKQLVIDSVMKELNELPSDQKKDLEEALKSQGLTMEEQVAKAAESEVVQKQTAMQLFVNARAEEAAKKIIDEEALKDHYEANRAQYPGSYEDEKEKIMKTLVTLKAPAMAKELDKEIEEIRKTVKYWKPEK